MSKTELKIIKLLSDFPEQEFYSQEIANKVECSKASTSLIMRSLVRKKMVYGKTKGKMRFYQINNESIEIKKIKINIVLEKINPLLPKLKKFTQKIILFGSGSRGEQTDDSDIDLFIISCEKSKILNALKKTDYASPIKAVIKTPGEWSEMEVKEPEFFYEIKNGITLYDYVSKI